jgi:membrane protease YdiL (CAAX protease family)
MEPENQPRLPVAPVTRSAADAALKPETALPALETQKFQWLRWTFIGDQGLRAGWSVLIFFVLFLLFAAVVGFAFVRLHLIDRQMEFTASATFFSRLVSFLALVGAATVVALVERRSLLAFNLNGPRRILHFLGGLVAGFAALSALIGALAWGHWLHFGPVALSGAAILKFGALWAAAFLLVGCVEEGTCRCYLQFTLTRGINFWWALGINAVLCSLPLLTKTKGNGVWGFYAVALLGLLPCLVLHLKKVEGEAFWQAAWVTSSLFGYVHTGNGGENPIGIFAAALIGFVFCVSIRVTGSAWWAIGCHAAWDWAETYFYGAADSGNVATGHYLTTSPAGNVLWSGGTDGPEGSLLVIGIILLLLAALLLIYGKRKQKPPPMLNSLLERAIG